MSQHPSPYEERREFFRIDFRHPVKFRQFREPHDGLRLGTVENISQAGILFKSRILPPLSTVLWMDLDFRTLKICSEIETRALKAEHGLLGKVVRVEEDDEERGVFNIGVCFLRKESKESKESVERPAFSV